MTQGFESLVVERVSAKFELEKKAIVEHRIHI
jgi:hypothetical protein